MFKKRERERYRGKSINFKSGKSVTLIVPRAVSQSSAEPIKFGNLIGQSRAIDWSEQAANVRSLRGKNVSHYILERNVHFRHFLISEDKPTAKCYLYSMTVIRIISLV